MRQARQPAAFGCLRRRAEAVGAVRAAGAERRLHRGDRQLLPAHGRESRRDRARRPRHHHLPRELPSASQAARVCRDAAARPSRRTARSIGPSARRWHSAPWYSKAPPVRLSGQDSGRGTFSQRHLAFLRFRDRPALCPAAAHFARAGALRRVRQLAQRIRRAGLRIRLQRGRSADAGDLGSAVRRFRQRRPDHDRPVHYCRPNRSGGSPAAW